MSIPKSEKWILVEWKNGGNAVVNVKNLVNPVGELTIGSMVIVNRLDGEHVGKIISSSRVKHDLSKYTSDIENPQVDLEIIQKAIEAHETSYPKQETIKPEVTDKASHVEHAVDEDDALDYSGSASSWEPSGESSEESYDEDLNSKLNISRRQYFNKKKVLVPSNRVNAIIPNSMKQHKSRNGKGRSNGLQNPNQGNRKQEIKESKNRKKSDMPLAFRSRNKINLNALQSDIRIMNDMFRSMLKAIRNGSSENYQELYNNTTISPKNRRNAPTPHNTPINGGLMPVTPPNVQYHEDTFEVNHRSMSEESNRSNDNVLISNKYNTYPKKSQNEENSEWIPIGTGQTLIHIDKYRTVKWRSYTVATRTLLLAAFPRRTLATHSLTGKRSPAFSNKPAKMCLDPKIVTDIIIEISERFNIRENLVRTIITTKCADECKMFKLRMAKKRKTLAAEPPPKLYKTSEETEKEVNQTL